MTEETRKFDLCLADGREIVFDFSKITHREWRDMLDPSKPDLDGFIVLSKVSGITAKELEDLSEQEAQSLLFAMYKAHGNPLRFLG